MIADWIRYMRVLGHSTATIKKYYSFIHQVFREAVDDEIIVRDPCRGTKLATNVPEREKVVLEADEFWLLHEQVHPDSQDFTVAAVGTGIRFGELSAVTTHVWDADQQVITVTKAWKRGHPGEGHYVGKPKTAAGTRLVHLSDPMAEIFERRAAGKGGDALLFTAARGGRVRGNVFGTTRWQPALARARAAGLTKAPVFHDLRHTHITWLRDAGMVDATITGLVGHSDPAMTARYGSVSQETIHRATAAIAARLVR